MEATLEAYSTPDDLNAFVRDNGAPTTSEVAKTDVEHHGMSWGSVMKVSGYPSNVRVFKVIFGEQTVTLTWVF